MYAKLIKNISLSDHDLAMIYEKLASIVSLLPCDHIHQTSGAELDCSCWQGKLINIGCWNFSLGLCHFSQDFRISKEEMVWKTNSFGMVIILYIVFFITYQKMFLATATEEESCPLGKRGGFSSKTSC